MEGSFCGVCAVIFLCGAGSLILPQGCSQVAGVTGMVVDANHDRATHGTPASSSTAYASTRLPPPSKDKQRENQRLYEQQLEAKRQQERRDRERREQEQRAKQVISLEIINNTRYIQYTNVDYHQKVIVSSLCNDQRFARWWIMDDRYPTYSFGDLPPGKYTIHLPMGQMNVILKKGYSYKIYLGSGCITEIKN